MEQSKIDPKLLKVSKIISLTYDQLMKTRTEKNAMNNIIGEVSCQQAVTDVLEMLDKKDIKHNVQHIWAVNNSPDTPNSGISISKELEDIYGEGDLRTLYLRRVYSVIRLDELKDEEHYPSIVIHNNQQGVEFIYGSTVTICDNLSIFGDTVIRNYNGYKKNKYIIADYKNMLKYLGVWVDMMDKMKKKDDILMDSMKNEMITDINRVFEFFGEMVYLANRWNVDRKGLPIFNVTQGMNVIRSFDQKYVKHINGKFALKDPIRVYDLYNEVTNQHKVDKVDSLVISYYNSNTYDQIAYKFKLPRYDELNV